MKSRLRGCLAFAFLLITLLNAGAQEQRAFNQNSSRSNHSRTFNQNAARSNRNLSFSVAPVLGNAVAAGADSLLFPGNGAGFSVGVDYFFGRAGISFSSGFLTSSPGDAAINRFIARNQIPQDQLTITKSRQQSIYILLGPSLNFGGNVGVSVHAKGGLFVNDAGMVNIQQKGAQRSIYRNEAAGKSVYPGFLAGGSVEYRTRSGEWSFGIGADYIRTSSELNNYDARRGGAIEPLRLSSAMATIATGVTVRYNIFSARDHSSGQASGKRSAGYGSPAAADASLGTDEMKTYQPGRPVYGNLRSNENCGPVIQTVTRADGSTEEMRFACPAAAAAYRSVKEDYTERPILTSSGMNQDPGASGGIISGRLSWPGATATGIVTNMTIGNSSGRGGSTTMNSQTSSTRQTQQNSFGTMVRLSAREAGSGQATGRRSREAGSGQATGRRSREAGSGQATGRRSREAGSGQATGRRSREAGSGQATGRRQYQPLFSEGGGPVCNPCLATAKMGSANNNPVYNDKGMGGENPLSDGKSRTTNTDDDCDGIGGIAVMLIDPASKAVLSRTLTAANGEFFFANVPQGDYIVKLDGSYLSKKGYDYYSSSKTDLLGKVEANGQPMELFINTDDGEESQQKAGISTSRSNIRCKSLSIVEADLDGDGEYESLRATAHFSDGSSRDVTSATSARSAPGSSKQIRLGESAFQERGVASANRGVTGIASSPLSAELSWPGGRLRATGTFSDGTTRDITRLSFENSMHDGVRQYRIQFEEEEGESVVKTKTKSNQSNDRLASDSGEEGIWSPRSNRQLINTSTGDLDGDGRSEMVAGLVPAGFAILRDREGGNFQNGDLPNQNRPGNPIGGLTIKGGKNPGGNLRTSSTDQEGEFEFTDLEPGDYTFVVEQRVYVNVEMPVTTGSKVQDHNSSRSNKTASTKAQDHNSSRSNKTASTRAQDHNSSRSNKTASAVAPDNDPSGGENENSDKLTGDHSREYLQTGNTTGPEARWTATDAVKRTVNSSRGNIRNLLKTLDDLEELLDGDSFSDRSIINTSRSNIKSQRISMYELRETLADIEYKDKKEALDDLHRGMMQVSDQVMELRRLLTNLGQRYSSISNVLKTKHDTVKNSINNIR